jgi:hypothetical protein
MITEVRGGDIKQGRGLKGGLGIHLFTCTAIYTHIYLNTAIASKHTSSSASREINSYVIKGLTFPFLVDSLVIFKGTNVCIQNVINKESGEKRTRIVCIY